MKKFFAQFFIPLLVTIVLFTGVYVDVHTTGVQVGLGAPKAEAIQAIVDGLDKLSATFDPKVIASQIAITGIQWMSNMVLTGFAFALWVSGAILEFTLEYTIVNMNSFVEGTDVIDIGWTVFRDVANMFFIFVILYIAIATILQLEGYNTKRLLAKVVLAAILMNFSLFFTKALIDFSNITTLAFYEKIVTSPTGGDTEGFSVQVLDATKIGTVYNLDPDKWGDNVGVSKEQLIGESLYQATKFAVGTLMGALIMLILAFSFLVVCIMFIGRFVALIFLMVLSPIMFFSWVLPMTKSYATKWWNLLIKQLIFPPVYFALIYFCLQVIRSFTDTLSGTSTLGKNGGFAEGFFSGKEELVGSLLLNYALIVAFIIGSLLIAIQTGAMGSGLAMKATNYTRKSLGRGMGMVGRNTIGRAADRFRESELMKKTVARNPTMGGLMLNATSGVAGASFGGAKRGYTGAQAKAQEQYKKNADFVSKDSQGKEVAGRKELFMTNLEKSSKGPMSFIVPTTGARDGVREIKKDIEKDQNRKLQEEAQKLKITRAEDRLNKDVNRKRAEVLADHPEKIRLDEEISTTNKSIRDLETEMHKAPDMRRSSDDIATEMKVFADKKKELIAKKLELHKKAKQYRADVRKQGEKLQEMKEKAKEKKEDLSDKIDRLKESLSSSGDDKKDDK